MEAATTEQMAKLKLEIKGAAQVPNVEAEIARRVHKVLQADTTVTSAIAAAVETASAETKPRS